VRSPVSSRSTRKPAGTCAGPRTSSFGSIVAAPAGTAREQTTRAMTASGRTVAVWSRIRRPG